MIIGIIGLGLIGGSFAKAFSIKSHTVLAVDTDKNTFDFAILNGVVHGKLTRENLSQCDLIIVAIYPQAAIKFLSENAEFIGSKPIVIDCCGTKRAICNKIFQLAKKNNFTFIGGHPMAGTERSGFKFSKPDMFKGTSMVIVPPDNNSFELLHKVKELLKPAEFGKFTVTTAEQHDRNIAYTSQLPHIIANAFIKSSTSTNYKNFIGRSYYDIIRVARLNSQMWTELFIENKYFLLDELNTLIKNITAYKIALENEDISQLIKLFEEGNIQKKEIDNL